ncbi:MAG TPA: LacI family DNA-binding transcriptional regulator [Streptosporangiaceae bacterium]|nr:LacI family DNA-binding transcriptional regulator [Streptosporangiaceae bacterium]
MPNISDVARRAGVSTATVSRFLRGQRVREEAAIRQVIDELGYRPKAAARSLRSGVHYAIAVVVPDVANPFFADLVKGIESVCRGGPYNVLLVNTDESVELEDAVVGDILQRVDGIILAPATEQDKTPDRIKESGVPVVFADRELRGQRFDSVLVDNAEGARSAAGYLAGLGHSRIAIISGPLNTTPGRERHDAFVTAVEDLGGQIPDEYRQISDFREGGGYQAMLRLLALPQPPTAVFCANNLMTVGALKALNSMRIRVPQDLSIIGFDDLDLAPLLWPPLTVIDRPTVEQGVLAARLLLARLAGQGDPEPQRVVLSTRLIERASCTIPPAGTR